MKKLLLLTFSFLFFYCGNSYSADCGDAAVVDCALTDAADEIVMSDGGTVTITSSGSIIVDDHDNGGLIQLPASTSNLTITNDGTLQVGQYDGVGSGTGENNAITATGTTTNVTITNSGVIAASGRHAINLQAAEGGLKKLIHKIVPGFRATPAISSNKEVDDANAKMIQIDSAKEV